DLAEIERLRDVRVLEVAREPRLVDERSQELRIGRHVRVQPLERDDAPEALDAPLLRAVHGGHPARSELLVHEVRPDLLAGVTGHGADTSVVGRPGWPSQRRSCAPPPGPGAVRSITTPPGRPAPPAGPRPR